MARKASDNPSPVYAVVGSDATLRRDALGEIIKVLSAHDGQIEPTLIDGNDAELAGVLDDLRTPSLLGDRRVVIVDGADAFISSHRQVLERYCGDPSPSGSLVLLCQSMPRNTKLYKIISQVGHIVAVEAPKGRAVIDWLVRRATEKHEKKLAPRAAQMLREHLGDAPGLWDAELAKLAAYVGQRSQITAEDIEVLTGRQREEKVFAITDAMANGDTATALAQWEQVLATDRAAPGRAIAGLAWGVRRLLEARRDFERGTAPEMLARRMFTDPATLRRRLERCSIDALQAQQRELLEADLAVKTGLSTVRLAVERFIVKHSQRGVVGASV